MIGAGANHKPINHIICMDQLGIAEMWLFLCVFNIVSQYFNNHAVSTLIYKY